MPEGLAGRLSRRTSITGRTDEVMRNIIFLAVLVIVIFVIGGCVRRILTGGTQNVPNVEELRQATDQKAGELTLNIYDYSDAKGDVFLGIGNNSNSLAFEFQGINPGGFGAASIEFASSGSVWACGDLVVTADEENVPVAEERKMGDETDKDGELGESLDTFWWADDGDGILENNENVFLTGKIIDLVDPANRAKTISLADSQTNIWGENPITSEAPRYLGLAWCHGDLIQQAVEPGEYAPEKETGFTCKPPSPELPTSTDIVEGTIDFKTANSSESDYICPAYQITPPPAN